MVAVKDFYNNMNITIIGTGYVGLVTGTCFAEMGNTVFSIDIDQEKIDNVNKEILRIIKENIRRTGFIDLMVRSTISQNDQLRNMFKHVINVRYRKDNP